MKKILIRSIAVSFAALVSISCVQKLFNNEAVSDEDLPNGVLPSSEMTYGNAPEEPYAKHAARFNVTATADFPYNLVELFGDGTYMFTNVPGKSGDGVYLAGGYTVEDGDRYSLEDFGTLKIETEGDNYSLLFDNLNGNRLSTVYGSKDPVLTDNASKSLCRTWDVNSIERWMYLGSKLLINTKYHGGENPYIEGIAGIDGEDMESSVQYECKSVRFSPSGTYTCTYNNGQVLVSTWKWGNAQEGILFYDWENGEQEEGYVTVRFSGKQMRIYEDYTFDLSEYLLDEEDEEESQAYINILNKFAGNSKLRYLLVNTMQAAK
jgi:hypothetical protein